ncbi:MAG: CBS domain-containing protein [Anaerolineales bacterium]|nr:MAG: CBS domain-containing protein [Anaerolineales bacterium]
MLVKEGMTPDPITVSEDTSVSKALDMMRQEKVRRFPVVGKRGKLAGIVLEKDLLYASPSPATTLSLFEIHTLLAKVTVADVMTREVVTVDEDAPIEQAARIMVDNNIGGLPVMREGSLVGIITETDLFKVFLEMLGARTRGVRLSVALPDEKGMLAKIAVRIADLGGNIAALGTTGADELGLGHITFKVTGAPADELVSSMKELGLKILDVREG